MDKKTRGLKNDGGRELCHSSYRCWECATEMNVRGIYTAPGGNEYSYRLATLVTTVINHTCPVNTARLLFSYCIYLVEVPSLQHTRRKLILVVTCNWQCLNHFTGLSWRENYSSLNDILHYGDSLTSYDIVIAHFVDLLWISEDKIQIGEYENGKMQEVE